MELMIGVAVLPNGHALCPEVVGPGSVGVPTRSMMIEVVSQKDANMNQAKNTVNILYSS